MGEKRGILEKKVEEKEKKKKKSSQKEREKAETHLSSSSSLRLACDHASALAGCREAAAAAEEDAPPAAPVAPAPPFPPPCCCSRAIKGVSRSTTWSVSSTLSNTMTRGPVGRGRRSMGLPLARWSAPVSAPYAKWSGAAEVASLGSHEPLILAIESVPGRRAFVGVCREAGLVRSGRSSEEAMMRKVGVEEEEEGRDQMLLNRPSLSPLSAFSYSAAQRCAALRGGRLTRSAERETSAASASACRYGALLERKKPSRRPS